MIVPEYLQKGDTVGVVATAKKVHKAHTLQGIELLKSWGLYVLVGEYVFAGHQQFAGTDEQRTQDFQAMIDNENVKAVLWSEVAMERQESSIKLTFQAE
jgi:muramoyltetrapeptide carboxypeptidase